MHRRRHLAMLAPHTQSDGDSSSATAVRNLADAQQHQREVDLLIVNAAGYERLKRTEMARRFKVRCLFMPKCTATATRTHPLIAPAIRLSSSICPNDSRHRDVLTRPTSDQPVADRARTEPLDQTSTTTGIGSTRR